MILSCVLLYHVERSHAHFTKRSGVVLFFNIRTELGLYSAISCSQAYFRSAKVELIKPVHHSNLAEVSEPSHLRGNHCLSGSIDISDYDVRNDQQ